MQTSSMRAKIGLGQVNCNRQFCQLECPPESRYIDGKSKIACEKYYETSTMSTEYRWNGNLGSCRVCPKPKVHDPRHDLQYACKASNGLEVCTVTCRDGFVFHDSSIDSYTISCNVETQSWSNVDPKALQCRKSLF